MSQPPPRKFTEAEVDFSEMKVCIARERHLRSLLEEALQNHGKKKYRLAVFYKRTESEEQS